MRYSASEKFEIIELVEQSSISICRTLAPIGIPRSTFYGWYSRYQEGGIEALEDGNGSGTRSPTRSGRRSLTWPSRSRTCRPGSSPSTSRTPRAALYPRLAFIGF